MNSVSKILSQGRVKIRVDTEVIEKRCHRDRRIQKLHCMYHQPHARVAGVQGLIEEHDDYGKLIARMPIQICKGEVRHVQSLDMSVYIYLKDQTY